MGLLLTLLFLVLIAGFCWIESDIGKKTREDMYELDSMRTEDEKHDSRLGCVYGVEGDELFKKKKVN